ncbi:MAG: sensor domain-containing diguanylate cyclase [Desulfobacterales bacterium]|nr:sensor domain-containing diguanylate cyclase [Desulfobacterales bacterium]
MSLHDGHYKKVLDNLYDGIYLLNEDRKIIYWNKGAETHTGYPGSDVIDMPCHQVLRHVDDQGISLCNDACPVSQTIHDNKLREVEVYLRHKEGHRIPVSMRIAPIKDSNNQVVVAVEICGEGSPKYTLQQKLKEMKELALLDPLSEIGNRRFLEMNIRGKIEELTRYKWPFGIIFADIDHFKSINDTFGHDTGDRVIQMVSRTISHSLRSFDVMGRWGGEEFVVIVVNVQEEPLYAVANRLRLLVEQSSIMIGSESVNVTVSMGATLGQSGDDVHSIVKRADHLMYKSKSAGRNCISMNSEEKVCSSS